MLLSLYELFTLTIYIYLHQEIILILVAFKYLTILVEDWLREE